jgi:GTPase SAR1 family protein
MGITIGQGKTLAIQIDQKMPFIEIRSSFSGAANQGKYTDTSKVLATECLDPPFEVEIGYYEGEFYSLNSTITFGREFVEKVSLLRTALNLATNILKTVLVIGERKCGKSTLCNYLSHQLTSNSDVFLLDLDCGQPFDNMPGFMHLRKVSNKRICNSTTWAGQRISSECLAMRFVGDYSYEYFPTIWTRKAEELLQYTKEKKLKGTLIVNTGGHAKGVGLQGLQSLISLFQPQVIAEISLRGDSIVRHLPQYRQFNHINSTGDFINSKTSVLSFSSIVPDNLKENFTSMKDSRNISLWNYFEKECVSHPILCSKIVVWLLESDQKHALNISTVSLEVIGLLLVGSICSIETVSGSEIPVLIEDLIVEEGKFLIRIQTDLVSQLPEDIFRLTKSEFIHIDHTSRVSKEDWQEEIETWNKIGQKVFWNGPLIGVGSRPLRRKVSSRKK